MRPRWSPRGSGAFFLLALALTGCDARLHLYIHGGRETLIPGRTYGDALITQGIVASVPPGRGLPPGEPARRFALRHPVRPPDWNGTLVIGAHRGLGGIRRGDGGADLGTGETELDDLIGWWALDQGFAWASMDRAGLGASPDGLRLTEAFARLMFDQLFPRLTRDPDRTILFGYAEGGGIARYAASAEEDTFDGVVLVAATLGDPEAARTRREARQRAGDRSSPEYVRAVGMGAAGRRFWPWHDAIAAFPEAAPPAPPAALIRPAIEVVGTLDDLVLPEVLAWRDRVQAEGAAELHELRMVEGAWAIGPDDDALEETRASAATLGLAPEDIAALGTGESLAPASRRALTDLDARLRN